MDSPILRQIAKFLQERKNQKRWKVVFVALAVIVGIGTATGLRMMGLAMTHKERVLTCPYQVHEHTKDCYDQENNVICGYADYVVHKHNDDCYNADLKLVCPLPEIEKHEHTEECYNEMVLLVCGQEETSGHEHTDACYTKQKGSLACTAEEHKHTDACYDEEKNLTCNIEEHTHNDNCYNWEDVLTCTLPAGEGGHKHTDACYQKQEGLTCGQLEMHTHTEKCFEKIDKDGTDEPDNLRLICDKLELVEHVHTEAFGCLKTVEVAPGETAEEAAKKEAEDDGVFTTDLNGEGENGEDSTAADGAEGEDSEAAGDGTGEAAEGEEGADGEAAGDEAGTDGAAEGEEGESADGEEAADAIDEIESTKPEDYDETKTYEGLGYIVSASYNKEANIPEEAKLIAEQITERSDSEDYKKHEAEFKKNMGDENATMSALFKIGFYVDNEEVEPESPVLVTIQFVDKHGLPEGAPIKVVHFGDEDTEVIDGGKAESGSTSFKTKGFSKFAVGFSEKEEEEADAKKEASVHIADSYEYEDAAFHITFHVEGDAKILKKSDKNSGGAIESEETLSPVNKDGDKKKTEKDTESSGNSGEDETSDDETVEDEASKADGESSAEEETSGTTENSAGEEASEDAEESSAEDKVSEAEEKDSEGKKLEFKVEHYDKESEEYKAVVDDAALANDGSELLFVQALSYSMYYGDNPLDLSDCEVTAEVKPANPLKNLVKDSMPDAVNYLRTEGNVPDTSTTETKDSAQAEEGESQGSADEFQTEITLELVKIADKKVTDKLDSQILSQEDTGRTSTFNAPQIMGARASGQPNPKFTVQYYANLDKVAYNDPSLKETLTDGKNTNELPVIDTTGGKLPGNGKKTTASPNDNPIRNLYVDTATGKLKTKPELTKVYEERPYEYHKAPTINYINALNENSSYELKEVWVLKDGKKAESIDQNDWNTYTYNDKLHFTNRELSAGTSEGETYVYIKDNATLRLVYDTTTKDKDFEAAFYDYDIGDGMIYSNQANAQNGNNGQPTSNQGTGTWYMRTGQQGINNPDNYTGEGTKLAFGNANTGSGLQHENWGGNLLNKHNGTQGGHPTVTGSYKGCTFGLVQGMQDGKIQYSSGVSAPNLFNDGGAIGKTAYDNYSLKFNKVGDTHTLKAVNGTGTVDLDSFNHPKPNASTTHYHIWTNNFWPMDSAPSFGTNNHDMKFGSYDNRERYKFAGQAGANGGSAAASGTFPWSDDGEDHNSYFGMHYKVEFELDADYTGPLEYYFFGDDDMWVFLGNKLVCDIGGVHSSVGEYLNLWDYIDKDTEKIHRHTEACYPDGEGEGKTPMCGYVDSKKFTLNFYYTERGESGSSCWMQFTLPSVSSLTPETTDADYGHLKIEKQVNMIVDGKEYPVGEYYEGEEGKVFKEKDYTFTLKLEGLKDDYAYVKYDRNGNILSGQGGVITWETIAHGETFTLKDGEYIRIKYLPKGSTYTITESDGTEITNVVYYGTDIIRNDKQGENSTEKKPYIEGAGAAKDLSISGTVPQNDISEIKYTNKYIAYALPETGGSGMIIYTIAGALCILLGAGFMYTKKAKERRV